MLVVMFLRFSLAENLLISNLIFKEIFVLHRSRGCQRFSFSFSSLKQFVFSEMMRPKLFCYLIFNGVFLIMPIATFTTTSRMEHFSH